MAPAPSATQTPSGTAERRGVGPGSSLPDPRTDDPETNADDIATFDRPMRDAPAPRRWMPAVVVGLGAVGVAYGASMVLAGPGAPAPLAAPITEIEYTTGVVDVLPTSRAPAVPSPPRRAFTMSDSAADSGGDEAALQAAEELADARRHAPVLVLSGDRWARSMDNSAPLTSPSVSEPDPYARDRASSRLGSDDIIRAKRAASRPDVTLLEGAFIPATLETAIQSDLPGSIRAVVGRDVYAADATRLLIPRGSRLIGAYRSGLVRGQSRVFAVWTRLIRPDGVSIALDAPVTDGAGRSGIGGRRDSHFLERFGSAVLLSLIDGAVVAAANNAGEDTDTRIVLQSGRDFSRAAEIALENNIDIPATVHVAPGARLQVFVNRDIDFSGVVAQSFVPRSFVPQSFGAPSFGADSLTTDVGP